ncbi:MAG: hypothetical protein A2418_03450 [Candidatus Brennerbacteria bacterium RIFOXYC1_FULL_41_11]|nr:MAG: hypothetical protein A2418_03450 [Candidatus Brennerbacteria bacterium RIFOXYC1_FULL_41_11]
MTRLENKNLNRFLGLGITLFLLFSSVFFVFAWQNPTVAPPGGNISELLNTGATPQTKTGDLTVNGNFVASSTMNVGTSSLWVIGDGNVGIGTVSPATKLDIDTGSNTSGLRLRGLAETTEIADIYVGANGRLVFSNASSTGAAGYLDFYSKDDSYGYLFRESNNLSTTYLNIYVVENGATDYVNFVVATSSSTPGLVINSDDDIGIGTLTPSYDLSFGGNVNRTLGMERITTAASAGKYLSIFAGGATSGGSNLNGGDLYLTSGISTGQGQSNVMLRVYGCYAGTYGGECTPGTATADLLTALTVQYNASLLLYGSAASLVPLYNVVDAANACDGAATAGTAEGLCIDVGNNNESEFKIMASGNMTLQGTSSISGDPDYAEIVKVNDYKSIEAGDIISAIEVDVNSVENVFNGVVAQKSLLAYDSRLLGVVSDNPGYLIDHNGTMNHEGGRIRDGYQPLALSGRVFVKISSENGEIGVGDYITSGTIPGVGMRATQAGRVIGMALQSWTSENVKEIGKIMVLVNNFYFDPAYSFNDINNLYIVYNPENDEKAVLKDDNGVINRISVFSNLVVANLKSGLLEAKKLVVDGVDILQKLNTQEQEIKILKQEIELLKINK